MRKIALGLAALGALTLVSAKRANANLLNNGSFETGDFSGWTTFGDTSYTGTYSGAFNRVVGDNGPAPQDGNYAAYFGSIFGTGGISQTITDTPGQKLLITGYYAGYSGPSSLQIAFDTTDLVNLNPGPDDHSGWTEFSAYVTGTGSDTFSISSYQLVYYNLLDDLSITAVSPVPEPSSWSMMLVGMVGLGFAGYLTSRRRGF